MPTTRTATTDLYYEMTGAGEPTLVLVHGMAGGAWVWDDQVARLSGAFRCVAYDRAGHSRSRTGDADQRPARHADDLARLIEFLGADRPIVVGSSSGGVVAVELLRRRPDLVRGAVVSEPPLFGIDPAAGDELRGLIAGPVGSAMREGGPPAALEAFLSTMGLWATLDERRRAAYLTNAGLLLPTLEAAGPSVTRQDLATLTTPVCVVAGDQGPPPLRRLARSLADALPDARHVLLRGAGHATYVDEPEAFARCVADFAAEVAATAVTRA